MESSNFLTLHKNASKNSTDDFDVFITFMQQSNDIWYIKDQDSRFHYINDCGLHYFSLPKGFNPEGKLDSECPTYLSEYTDVIQANDRTVMNSQKVLSMLFTSVYGGKHKSVQPFILDVTPLIKDDKSIGVIGTAKKVNIFSMLHLEKKKYSNSLVFGNPSELFTDKEFNVAFYVLQSLSVREIANRLTISPNTVKKYLQSLYEKTGVSAQSQFIEYCRSRGYDEYAPNNFMCKQPYKPLVS